MRIGIVAPQTGNLEVLGRQILLGARLAAAEGKAEIFTFDESCEDGSGADIAEAMVEAKVAVAVGFLCGDTLSTALPRLGQADIPAITVSVRSDILMQDALKKHWPLFRLAPNANAERDKIIEVISRDWKDIPYAILDDGTINSRELAEGVRNAMEEQGQKAAFLDTFRPAQEVQSGLVRRLAKAGVSHILITGDRNDTAIIARDAKNQKRDFTFLGGDQLKANEQNVALEPGVLAVMLPDMPSPDAAQPVLDALGAMASDVEGYVLPAHAAVSVAIEAGEIADASGAPISEALVDTPFSTAWGPVRFDARHELATNPFVLMRWNGKAFEAVPPAPESN